MEHITACGFYDTNRDGRIDAFEDVFKNLKVWQDRDGDGRTDERELKNLAELGIKAKTKTNTKIKLLKVPFIPITSFG